MEKPEIIESKNGQNDEEITEKGKHAEAVALVERHRDFFEHYAKGGAKIIQGEANAFNFITKTITINPAFYDGLDFSEQMTIHSCLHEIEHLLEDTKLFLEDGGERVFNKLMKRLNSSNAYALMSNVLSDIRENRTIISKKSGMIDLQKKNCL